MAVHGHAPIFSVSLSIMDASPSSYHACSSFSLTWKLVQQYQRRLPQAIFPVLTRLVLTDNEFVAPILVAPLLEEIVCEVPGAMVTPEWLTTRVATHHPLLKRIVLNRPDTTSNALVPYDDGVEENSVIAGERGISFKQLKALPDHVGGLSFALFTPDAVRIFLKWLNYAYSGSMEKRQGTRLGYLISSCFDDEKVDFNTKPDSEFTMDGMTWISYILLKYPGLFDIISVNMIGSLIESASDDEEYFGPIVKDIQRLKPVPRALGTQLVLAMGGNSAVLHRDILSLGMFREMSATEWTTFPLCWLDSGEEQDEEYPCRQYLGQF